jgi:2-polyprenyl-6-methoxyphenol hydroxylase-like FAD-dependent oxidoreductase
MREQERGETQEEIAMAQKAMESINIPVAIVGAGPVGLSLALGLARHGVRSLLIERNDRTSEYSKAAGLHIRTREVFRQWGIEHRFLDAGMLMRSVTMHSVVPGRKPLVSLDFSDLENEADQPGLLLLEQAETERLLLEAVKETGLCEVRFQAEATALEHGETGARLVFDEGGRERRLDAQFVVGCDGASSFVREALGLPFDGMTYSLRPLLADVTVNDERDNLPQPRVWTGAGGYAFAARLRPGLWRIVHLPHGKPAKEEVSDEEVYDQVSLLLGPGPIEVLWASRFRIHRRSSPTFRVGNVLLAGDAAHVHSPASGYGMNGGIHDAHNLAWKLAFALQGGDRDRLLDSYEVERRAVMVGRVSRYTDFLTRTSIQAPQFVRESGFFLIRSLQRIPSNRRRQLRRTSMLDLDYRESPLLNAKSKVAGVRLPNPRLDTPDGDVRRLYDLLPTAPGILDVAEGRPFAEALPVENAIKIGPGEHHDPTGLLRGLLGGKDGWILVRPDAHIAWARHRRDGMDEAVRHALAGYHVLTPR